MFSKTGIIAAATVGLLAVVGSAEARLNPEDWIGNRLDATILNVDHKDHEITVRFDENDEVATYRVAEDAKFFTFDGAVERPVAFGNLRTGESLELTLSGIPGRLTLAKAMAYSLPNESLGHSSSHRVG